MAVCNKPSRVDSNFCFFPLLLDLNCSDEKKQEKVIKPKAVHSHLQVQFWKSLILLANVNLL